MDLTVFTQIGILFSMIAIGYLIAKLGVLNAQLNQKFSSFLLKVPLPATILSSAMGEIRMGRRMILFLILIVVAIFLLLPIFSFVMTKLLRMNNVYQMMLNYSNLGFMGLPIIRSVFGEEYTFYAAIFMMIFNLHIFSVGVIILNGKPTGIRPLVKKLCSPAIIASLLAVVLVFFPIPFPSMVTDLASSLGGITTPLAMIIIGSNLAQVRLLDCLKNYKLYLMSLLKLAVIPAIVYVCLSLILGADHMITKVATIEMGLPVASNVTMLCAEYDGDVALASEGTCISTLLSLISIPILLTLIC